MMLKGDLISGATESSSSKPYTCTCDGQFSGHEICRQKNNDQFTTGFAPKDLGLCLEEEPNEVEIVLSYRRHIEGIKKLDCTTAGGKKSVIVLQGGLQFRMDVNEVFRNVVDSVVSSPKFKDCLRLDKVRVIWISSGAQSR